MNQMDGLPGIEFLQQQTYATLFSLANKLQVKGDAGLNHFTSRQLMAMIAIVHLPKGEVSINNIARKLGSTKQSTKQVISLIQGRGLVTTIPSPKDRRAVEVLITPEGNRALAEDFHRGMAYFSILFQAFSPEELNTLWSLLKKLYRFDGEAQDGFEEEVSYQP